MVSIMSGIENFAPDRTNSSSGRSSDPNEAPAVFSSHRSRLSISVSTATGTMRLLA